MTKASGEVRSDQSIRISQPEAFGSPANAPSDRRRLRLAVFAGRESCNPDANADRPHRQGASRGAGAWRRATGHGRMPGSATFGGTRGTFSVRDSASRARALGRYGIV